MYIKPIEKTIDLKISKYLLLSKSNLKLDGSENPKITSAIDDANATLVYGIEKDQSKIHIVMKIKIYFFCGIKFFNPKKGNIVKGEKDNIDTIIALGPI